METLLEKGSVEEEMGLLLEGASPEETSAEEEAPLEEALDAEEGMGCSFLEEGEDAEECGSSLKKEEETGDFGAQEESKSKALIQRTAFCFLKAGVTLFFFAHGGSCSFWSYHSKKAEGKGGRSIACLGENG